MKKKKTIISLLALAIVLIGGYQITMANFNQNGAVDAKISAGKLGIEIYDFDSTKQQENGGQYQFSAAMPGSIMTRQVGIENTKDKDVYVRVILTRYWNDSDGNKRSEANPEYINILTEQKQQWIIMEDTGSNQERIIFYCKKPVRAGEKTTSFMDAIQLSEGMTDQIYSMYHANIKVEAEAIQAAGASDAMASQWGVEVSFDDQGNIATVVE